MAPFAQNPHRVAFLTLPNYSMIALTSALEACRMANYVAGVEAYRWTLVTADGAPVAASNGLTLGPTAGAADVPADLVLVCGGVDVRHSVSATTLDVLRRADRGGIRIGAICTGTFALAEAGLLDGHRAAIHWENLAAIREEFPSVAFTDDAYVIERDRLTCTGGVAPLGMMLELIGTALGPAVAEKVAAQLLVRSVADAARQRRAAESEVTRRHPALGRAIAAMRGNLEQPLALAEVAAGAALSPRQMERLFQRALGTSPGDFYRGLRLERARELLRLSPLPVTDVALACGFQSAAHFSAAYGRRYGHPPRAERQPARGHA